MSEFIKIERGDGQKVRPAYDSADFEEYCRHEKAKGLRKEFWPKLPEMWEAHLAWRAKLESALDRFTGVEERDEDEGTLR